MVRVHYKGKLIDTFPTEHVLDKYGFDADVNPLAKHVAFEVIYKLNEIFGDLPVMRSSHNSYIYTNDKELIDKIKKLDIDVHF